ncbi:MAG: alpha/beta fold hydrolase [Haloglomus sp.]
MPARDPGDVLDGDPGDGPARDRAAVVPVTDPEQSAGSTAAADSDAVSLTTHDVSGTAGTLCVSEWRSGDADEGVLFVHGATYPGRAIFGPGLDETPGWGPWTAARGVAALALDVRGYGGSHPVEADASEPPVRTAAAAADLAAAVSWARDRVDRLHLVGTSWGTLICGTYLASRDDPPVASVTLHAPVYDLSPAVRERLAAGGPFRTATRDGARERWAGQVPTDADTDAWLAEFDAFWTTYVSNSRFVIGADEDNHGPDSATVRVPNGCLADILATADGDSPYDPADVSVPALVVRGTADHTSVRSDALGVYDRLGGAPGENAYAEVDGGTHFVHLEPPRERLFDLVRAFQRGQ